MLDFAHRLTLRAIANGTGVDTETPAVQHLVAAGLIARDAGGEGYVATEQGRAALAASGG